MGLKFTALCSHRRLGYGVAESGAGAVGSPHSQVKPFLGHPIPRLPHSWVTQGHPIPGASRPRRGSGAQHKPHSHSHSRGMTPLPAGEGQDGLCGIGALPTETEPPRVILGCREGTLGLSPTSGVRLRAGNASYTRETEAGSQPGGDWRR